MKQLFSRRWLGVPGAALGIALLLSVSASRHAVAQPATLTGAQFDLTGNQVVNSADLDVAAESWNTASEGGALGLGGVSADLNADGATDVADVQLLAAQVGQATTPTGLAAIASRDAMQPNAEVPELPFVVNSAASGNPNSTTFGDANKGDRICATISGSCTLQAAVQESNAPRTPPYRAVISFNVRDPGDVCPAIVRILPNLDFERWLQIDDSSGLGTVIDGYSQCGAQANSNDIDGNAVIKVEIVGTKFGVNGTSFPARDGVNGIEIKSANVVIRGLALYNWDRALELSAPGALYNQIQGNFIGTDAPNTFISKPRSTHHGEGIRLQFGASYTVIGCGSFDNAGSFQPCTTRAEVNAARNIVAGNGNDGIHIERQDSAFNRIVGNYIGVSQSGRRILSNGTSLSKNQADGVDFEDGANNNWLGGESELERNIVAGNVSDGIEISHNVLTKYNRVVNNYFGLDAYGEIAANGNNGVSFEDQANNNFAYKNVIGGNVQSGVRAYVLASENQIYDNFIGLLPDGSARPNGRHGVFIMGGSHHNIVRNNTIAFNGDRGVVISTESDADHNLFGETYFNTISRNSSFNNFREGIKLTNLANPAPIGNQGLVRPLILAANTTLVVGTTCPNCRVEIFISDKSQLPDPGGENSGEGRTFVGDGIATGGGEFAVTISGVNVGQLLTATGTDQSGNTSEFARNLRVGEGVVATLTPQPTATSTPTATNTPTPTSTLAPGETPQPTNTPTATRIPGQAPYSLYLPALRR